MGFKRKIISAFINILPYSFLRKNYVRLKKSKFADFLDQIYYEKFFKKSKVYLDFEGSIDKLKNSNKYCVIREGNWSYKVINFCFVREMLSNIIWSIENGYIPVIDVYPDKSGVYKSNSNLWEKMFLQPFGKSFDDIKDKDYIICPVKSYVYSSVFDVFELNKLDFWSRIVERFLLFNNNCKKYIDDETDSIVTGKKVLACLGRGTDYTDTKPKGHPVQPSIEELLNKSEEFINKYTYEYIYLATEEKRIADAFKGRFYGKILENNRNYYDADYEQSSFNRISQVNFGREDDDFLKSLEYFSSINILAHCDSLVAGLCGGSEFAVYFNGNKYRECYLFDKGRY